MSSSRNGSDSESILTMFRTFIKPRLNGVARATSAKRGSRRRSTTKKQQPGI
jgi:hypothetical protein